MPSVIIPDTSVSVTPTKDIGSPELFRKWEERFLSMLRDAGVREIRGIIVMGLFKKQSGRLSQSIKGSVEGNAVIWYSDAPYARALEKGFKGYTMWNLQDRVIPLVIHKYGGQVKIFRRATLKALMQGRFRHPGLIGKEFMRRGIQNAVREVPRLLAEARNAVVMVL